MQHPGEQIIRSSLRDVWHPSYEKIKTIFPKTLEIDLTSRYTTSLQSIAGASPFNILNIFQRDQNAFIRAFAALSGGNGKYSLVCSKLYNNRILNAPLCDCKAQPTTGTLIDRGPRDGAFFLFGCVDGSVQMASIPEPGDVSVLAEVFNNHRKEPILAIHGIRASHAPSYSATNLGAAERRFLFWIIYTSAVDVIACDIVTDIAPNFYLVASFAIDCRTLGEFSRLEVSIHSTFAEHRLTSHMLELILLSSFAHLILHSFL